MMRILAFAPALVVLTALAVACGGPDFDSIAEHRGDVNPDEFAKAATYGIDHDYGPYRSPAEAVAKVDAIVVGRARVVSVAERPRRDGYLPRYLVFEVSVEETILGEPLETVYALWEISQIADAEAIARSTPTTATLWMLRDASDWPPYHEMSGVPDGAVFFFQPDGMWASTIEGDFFGIGEARATLEYLWGPVGSFEDLVAMIREAARPTDPDGAPTPVASLAGGDDDGAVFRGLINGIRLGASSGPLPECEESATPADWEMALYGTFYDVRAVTLPARLAGAARVGVCADDGRVIWVIGQYEVGSNGSVQISRWENVRWYPQEFVEDSVSAGTIAARPAVFADAGPSGAGQTAVFVVDEENGGSTALLSSDVPLHSLKAIAEALYGPREALHTEGGGGQAACHGEPPKDNLTWFVGRTVDNLMCVRWEDRWENELGFAVRLVYPNEPLELTFELPANSAEFIIPPQHQPGSFVSLDDCLRRKDWTIETLALLPSTRVIVGGMGAGGECAEP
jgi:hypothetical protein